MQTLSRSSQRAEKLHETLRAVRTNAAMVEEMMVWLIDCHALLTAKEKDSIPDDLTVVDELVKEQRVSCGRRIIAVCFAIAYSIYCSQVGRKFDK